MENTAQVEAPQFLFADKYVIDDPANAEFYHQLLRGMTHKLNNLLAVIQGFSSLIMMDEGLDESITENLGHMKEAAQNASGLSERVLPAGGCIRVAVQDLKLNEFLPMVEDSLRGPCKTLNVPFHMNVRDGLPAVQADPGRLKEIIMELLRNAAEAAAANGGEVGLDILGSTGEGARRVDVFVRNTGSTINPEKIAEIFRPFNSTKDSSHFGVGLTIAAVLSNQMKMRLGVHSENNTTTFWLSIPTLAA
jgi:signal transduction histidine kinase